MSPPVSNRTKVNKNISLQTAIFVRGVFDVVVEQGFISSKLPKAKQASFLFLLESSKACVQTISRDKLRFHALEDPMDQGSYLLPITNEEAF